MSVAEALSRTTLLMRTVLRADAPDQDLLEALLGTEVALIADANNVSSTEGQTALIAAAGLITRSGAQCYLEAPNVPLQGTAAPLSGTHLAEALFDFGTDLIPGRRIVPGIPPRGIDLAVMIGDSSWSGEARQVISMSGNRWTGRIGINGERWAAWGCPLGALASAGLAAGEAYKAARTGRHTHVRSHPRWLGFTCSAVAAFDCSVTREPDRRVRAPLIQSRLPSASNR